MFCREIRECLKLDPDHKDCFPFYKKVKKLVKQIKAVQDFINNKAWEDCITKAQAMLKTESEVFQFIHRAKGHICHCHAKVRPYNVCDNIRSKHKSNDNSTVKKYELRRHI